MRPSSRTCAAVSRRLLVRSAMLAGFAEPLGGLPTAACSGLRPEPDCRPRRNLPSSAAPCLNWVNNDCYRRACIGPLRLSLSCHGQNYRVQAMDRGEGYAKSLTKKEHAVYSLRAFPAVLFSALLGIALFDPGAAVAQEVKQIKLTERQIESFISAHREMAKLPGGVNADKPDPKVNAQAEAIAKKNGFASL